MTKIQKDYKDYKRHVWDGKMANIKETRRGKSKEILKRANERNTSEWNCLVLSWLLGSFLYVEKKITTRARLCCRNGCCLMRHEANTNNYKDWIICLSCLQHGLIFQRGPWCTGDTWEAITTALTSNNHKEMNGWTDWHIQSFMQIQLQLFRKTQEWIQYTIFSFFQTHQRVSFTHTH